MRLTGRTGSAVPGSLVLVRSSAFFISVISGAAPWPSRSVETNFTRNMILRSFLTCISLCAIFLTEAQTGKDSLRRQAPALAGDTSLIGQANALYRAGRYFE